MCRCDRPARAATIDVNSTADVSALDGHCSLREAIHSADSDIVLLATDAADKRSLPKTLKFRVT